MSSINYQDLIAADPGYMSFTATAAEQRAKAAAARAASLRQLVTRYGGLGSFGDKYGDIDEATRAAAASNQFSDLSRLQQGYDQSLTQGRKSLAARRMLRSGELDYMQNQLSRQRGESEYDLGQSFLNTANQILNSYLGVEDALGAQQAAEATAAAGRAGSSYVAPAPAPSTLEPVVQAAPTPAPGGGLGGLLGQFGRPIPGAPQQDSGWYKAFTAGNAGLPGIAT